MSLPYLSEGNPVKKQLMQFGGYHHDLVIADGEFYDMKNMSMDEHPILSPRKTRGNKKPVAEPGGIMAKEKLAYVDGEAFYYGDTYCGKVTPGKKQFVSIGAYILIFPDKAVYNTQTEMFDNLENHFICPNDAKVTISGWKNGEKLEDPKSATLVQIECEGIGRGFEKQDSVILSGFNVESLNKTVILQEVFNDYIVVIGAIDENTTQDGGITVSRSVPDMDFMTEDSNRIWGCSSEKREIYACKLGDPFNWNCFEGLASDSYALVIGSDGDFTGCTAFGGNILFFKEDMIHKIYGTKPANYQLINTNARGIEKGSEKSLVNVNETLFYKSRQGICAYEGGLPYLISDNLGKVRYKNAAAGALDHKLYISMQDEDEEWHMFVFDTENALWSKEDNIHVQEFASLNGNLYFINDTHIGSIYGDDDEQIEWMIETGNMLDDSLDHKIISKIQLNMELEEGANANVYMRFDEESYERVYSVIATKRNTFSIPIIPRRCSMFSMRVEGEGHCRIFGMAKYIELGSELF